MSYVLQADATSLPLADESVDLIVTSPPYFALRSYQDSGKHYEGQIGSEATPQDFLEALWRCTEEMVRVLKPSGSIFVNLGDKYTGSGAPGTTSGLQGRRQDGKPIPGHAKVQGERSAIAGGYNQATIGGARPKSLMGLPWRYALGCIDQLDLVLRAEIVWSKPNGLPESVTDRVRRSHEQWFHFTKEPRYFSAVDEIRDPATDYQRDGVTIPEIPGQRKRAMLHTSNPLGKLPGSVWSIPTEPLQVPEHLGIDHFAAFPTEWPRRLLLGWCPPEGIVLDPFGGTGTTAMVARALGRTGISIDLSHDYSRLARWRIFESGHAKKPIGRTALERQGVLGGRAS